MNVTFPISPHTRRDNVAARFGYARSASFADTSGTLSAIAKRNPATIQPKFGIIGEGGIFGIGTGLQELLNMTTISGGVDMTLTMIGRGYADAFELEVMSVPLKDRYALIQKQARRRGLVRFWTYDRVKKMIEVLPEKTHQQVNDKRALIVDTFKVYFNQGDHLRAFAIANRMRHDDDFRIFMRRFYKSTIDPLETVPYYSKKERFIWKHEWDGRYTPWEWALFIPFIEGSANGVVKLAKAGDGFLEKKLLGQEAAINAQQKPLTAISLKHKRLYYQWIMTHRPGEGSYGQPSDGFPVGVQQAETCPTFNEQMVEALSQNALFIDALAQRIVSRMQTDQQSPFASFATQS